MWRRQDEFVEHEGVIEGGSSPVLRKVCEVATGEIFVAKCSFQGIGSESVRRGASLHYANAGPHEEEIREALALVLYKEALNIQVPRCHLCVMPAILRHPMEDGDDFGLAPNTSTVHLVTHFEDGFIKFGPEFPDLYRGHSRARRNERFQVQLPDGRSLPLLGFGALLAAADVLDDRDVLGASGSNAGYIVVDNVGHVQDIPNCRVFKIDAGLSFESRHNGAGPTQIVQGTVFNRRHSILYKDLTVPDQREYIATLKLATGTLLSTGDRQNRWAEAVIPPPDSTVVLPLGYTAHLLALVRTRLTELARNHARKLESAVDMDWAIDSAALAANIGPGSKAERIISDEDKLNAQVLHTRSVVPPRIETRDGVVAFQVPSRIEFVGREQEMEMLRNAISHSLISDGRRHVYAIVGIGGIGKSTLASRVAWLAARGDLSNTAGDPIRFSHVFYFRAEHKEDIDAQMIKLAQAQFGLVHEDTQQAMKKVFEAVDFADGPTLLILDNWTSDLQAVDAYIPPATGGSGQCHTVVTSRNVRQTLDSDPVVNLNTFEIHSTSEIVTRQLGTVTPEIVLRLQSLTNGLPLAVSQAIGYAQSNKLSLAEVLDEFEAANSRPLLFGTPTDELHPQALGTWVYLQMERMGATSPEATVILCTMIYLPPDRIRLEDIARLVSMNSDTLEHGLNVLQSAGLITSDVDFYRIHRLTQTAVGCYAEARDLTASIVERTMHAINLAFQVDEPSIVRAIQSAICQGRMEAWSVQLAQRILQMYIQDDDEVRRYPFSDPLLVCWWLSGRPVPDIIHIDQLIHDAMNLIDVSFDHQLYEALRCELGISVTHRNVVVYERFLRMTERFFASNHANVAFACSYLASVCAEEKKTDYLNRVVNVGEQNRARCGLVLARAKYHLAHANASVNPRLFYGAVEEWESLTNCPKSDLQNWFDAARRSWIHACAEGDIHAACDRLDRLLSCLGNRIPENFTTLISTLDKTRVCHAIGDCLSINEVAVELASKCQISERAMAVKLRHFSEDTLYIQICRVELIWMNNAVGNNNRSNVLLSELCEVASRHPDLHQDLQCVCKAFFERDELVALVTLCQSVTSTLGNLPASKEFACAQKLLYDWLAQADMMIGDVIAESIALQRTIETAHLHFTYTRNTAHWVDIIVTRLLLAKCFARLGDEEGHKEQMLQAGEDLERFYPTCLFKTLSSNLLERRICGEPSLVEMPGRKRRQEKRTNWPQRDETIPPPEKRQHLS